MTQVPLDDLLPHRPPMVLIDAVESFDAETRRLVARVTIGENQLFFDGKGVPNWVAIEYMAQTAAALVGYYDKHVAPGQPARPGLLLGTRKLDLKLSVCKPIIDPLKLQIDYTVNIVSGQWLK